jgi:signal transduction histidine kinase
VISATHASGGAIQLLDETGEWLRLHAHAGLDVEVVAQLEVTSADSGLSGWAATHEDELTLNDVNRDQRTTDVIRQSDVNVYAGVPMTVQGRVIGVVSVFRERRRSFGADDLTLLSSVADQVASVVAQREVLAKNEHLLLVEERNRLARELHDAVTQSLYSLMLFAGATKRQLQNGHLANALQFTTQLEGTAQQALKEMRLLLHNLRPTILMEVGLVRALRQRLDAVEARAGIKATLSADEVDLAPQLEEAIYFIASEALNNALKHAHATTVHLTLQQSPHGVTLTISDDGIGFDPAALRDSGGLGLASMRERSEKLGAALTIVSAENCGTTLTLILPSD